MPFWQLANKVPGVHECASGVWAEQVTSEGGVDLVWETEQGELLLFLGANLHPVILA